MYNFNLGGLLWFIGLGSAVAGWAVIETLLWLLSHISISLA
ncbi:hypothetical protein [Stutzerimonas stutzeri]|nr:hypothetical protein [Stutzerimonas stutzeri]